jgi:hypothetical protein
MKGRLGRLARALVVLSAVSALFAIWTGVASATNGTLNVCKDTQPGTQFHFTAQRTVSPFTTYDIWVTGGSCTPATLPNAIYTVSEDLSSGLWQVQSISVTPATAEISGSRDLTHGSTQVRVNNTIGTTTVRYRNQQASGVLKLCKWSSEPTIRATNGVPNSFSFSGTVDGHFVTRSVNAASSATEQAGTCSAITITPGGVYTFSEQVPAGEYIAGVSGSGAVNNGDGSFTVTTGPGTNYVFVDDEYIPQAQYGEIEICKDAYDSFVTGTFHFTVTDSRGAAYSQTADVDVGYCSDALTVAAGQVTVAETLQPGILVKNVYTEQYNRLVSQNDQNGTAVVSVPVDQSPNSNETTVHFVNQQQLTTLKICKNIASGSSVLAGKPFLFDLTGPGTPSSPISIPAGQCYIVRGLPVGATINVSEEAVQWVGVNGAVPNQNGDGTGGTMTATLGPAANQLNFLNKAYGSLELCKYIYNFYGYDNIPFDFGVSNLPKQTVLSNSCNPGVTVPVGSVTVSENAKPGFKLYQVVVDGTVASPANANPITVTIGFGTTTEVEYYNNVNQWNFKVCKSITVGSTDSFGGLDYYFDWFINPNNPYLPFYGPGRVHVNPPGTGQTCSVQLPYPGLFNPYNPPVVEPDGTTPIFGDVTEEIPPGAAVYSIKVKTGTGTLDSFDLSTGHAVFHPNLSGGTVELDYVDTEAHTTNNG